MKAKEIKLLTFLKNVNQMIVPIYQRQYSWKIEQCQQLWNDIMRAGSEPSINVHFIGSIVYIEESQSQISDQSPVFVIDGQQRVTSVTLLLAALVRALGDREPIQGFRKDQVIGYYLLNSLETGSAKYKLLLSETDRNTLISIVENTPPPVELSLRVTENFEFFQNQINLLNGNLEQLCQGILKLMIVDVALTRGQDNPQLIFESMNSTGKKLSQADLIRNYVLMGLEPVLQSHLYSNYWRHMELEFGQEGYNSQFDAFVRHYLTVKTGEIPRKDDVYEEFKIFANPIFSKEGGIEEIVANLRKYANYFCCMALGMEKDVQLKNAFHDLNELKVDVAYPLLLELYDDYSSGILGKNDFEKIVRYIESFVFRRTICWVPTQALNKIFCTFARNIDKDNYLESVEAHFLNLQTYRRFPTDKEFKRDLQIRDIYNYRSRNYWLRRLENFDRRERAYVNDYTIEHIMPQNKNLSPQWKNELGGNWQEIHQKWLHTLGNLTLTAYNSEYSDRPFSEKRDMENGFGNSPLRLNAGLGSIQTWNEDAIKQRAEGLSERALKVWASPSLDADVLSKYLPKRASSSNYSINDHENLRSGNSRILFDVLSKELLALDPSVTMDILKKYVAFKADTNFVDIVPFVSSLRISFNIKFNEIDDPKGLCRDVTNIGRWGNGDAEIKIDNVDDIPYVIGLARQALEKQLGEELA